MILASPFILPARLFRVPITKQSRTRTLFRCARL